MSEETDQSAETVVAFDAATREGQTTVSVEVSSDWLQVVGILGASYAVIHCWKEFVLSSGVDEFVWREMLAAYVDGREFDEDDLCEAMHGMQSPETMN